jgi:rhamnogalacturonan acetylesterase
MMNFARKNINLILLGTAILLLSSFVVIRQANKPTLYLIGDSTVKNGKGKGDGGLWGWGNYIADYFDTTRIAIENDALGGTSSRTFQTKGLWDNVLVKIKPGDYVMMQFGHNDSGALDDSARARGTIHGVGDEQKDIFNPILKRQETVYTYGWYLRKFVSDTRAKGATPIICTLIPRDNWKDGKVNRNNVNSYGEWATEVAKQTGTYLIDLNNLIADDYDKEGQDKVKTYFGPKETVHTGLEGAQLNANFVITGVKLLPTLTLNKYLK